MKENYIELLGYEGELVSINQVASNYPDFSDLEKIGIDNVYFSDNSPTAFFLEMEDFSNESLKRIAEVQHKAWNYSKVILLFAWSDTEIRIFNCYATPKPYTSENTNMEDIVKSLELIKHSSIEDSQNSLALINYLFSRVGVDCGLLWNEDNEISKKIDLQRRLDKYLVSSLKETAKQLQTSGLNKEIIHSLLLRSLFILYLEDKGAATETRLYEGISEECHSYFDILKDKEKTYLLFEELQNHFNGNITSIHPQERDDITETHLALVRNCFIDGNVNSPSIFEDWRLFDFKIIHIELISEIYDNFLGEMKAESGQYYTPYSLVELILSEKIPVKNRTNYDVKILDPACGSGIFLVEAYRRLVKRWKNEHPNEAICFETLRSILIENIFGIEIDPVAIKVASFSLYLALIDYLEPKTLWINENYKLPNLISDQNNNNNEEQGSNLLRTDTMLVSRNDLPIIDLVIGNPPFGTSKLPTEIKEYCDNFSFAKEYVLPFMHKATYFCPTGEIALIFNSKVLTNLQGTYANFRKWLFKYNYVTKLYNLSVFRKTPENFGGQLFANAKVPISIVYYSHNIPEIPSDTIIYWYPKTYIKSNLIEGVVIDYNDIKYLPRTESQNPTSKIWKIAMWGTDADRIFINRLSKSTLGQFFNDNDVKCITGLNGDKDNMEFTPDFILNPKMMDRYYTNTNQAVYANSERKQYRSLGDFLMTPPFVVFNKFQKNKEINCSYLDVQCFCKTGAYMINGNISNNKKKVLTAYLNSDIVKYYLFLTSSQWGIEREQILLKEILSLPSPFTNKYTEEIEIRISNKFDQLVDLKKELINDQIQVEEIENNILDEFIYCLSITSDELSLINDMLDYQLDLFENQARSIAVNKTGIDELSMYTESICKSLNTFVKNASLNVSGTIYDSLKTNPLNLVSLKFSVEESIIKTKDNNSLSTLLDELNESLTREKAPNIYVRKKLVHYDGDYIHIVKTNQKRFWTKTQAREDAAAIIVDILNMKN